MRCLSCEGQLQWLPVTAHRCGVYFKCTKCNAVFVNLGGDKIERAILPPPSVAIKNKKR